MGYDRSVAKAYTALSTCFSEIDSYLCDEHFHGSQADFLELPIIADNVYISKEAGLQTSKHRSLLKAVDAEYNFFKNNIYRKENIGRESLSAPGKLQQNQFLLKDVIRLHFDVDNNKFIIEGKEKDPIQYDYLVVQSHQLVTEMLYDHGHNLFSVLPTQGNILINLDFEIEKQHPGDHLSNECIYIQNVDLKTVFDNWYICNLSLDRLRVSTLIPGEQSKSAEFLDFITQRIRAAMAQAFETITFKELIDRRVSAIDGFDLAATKLVHPKYSCAFPSFTFWSQEKVNFYVVHQFLAKNKTNRALFYGKDAT